MIRHYVIYEARFMSLNKEDGAKAYKAVPSDKLKTGVYNPRYDMTVYPESVGEVDAENPEQAVKAYAEKIQDLY